MSLSQLSFVILFLPVCLLVYWLTPSKHKNVPLLLFSLLFIAWGSPRDLLLIGCSVLFHFFTGLQLQIARDRGRRGLQRFVLLSGVTVDLLMLGFFKYYAVWWNALASALGMGAAPAVPLPPIGISFFTFSALSYLLDIQAGRARAQRRLDRLALYICCFPKLISGPIAAYHTLEEQLSERKHTRKKTEQGVRRFVIGLAKKILIADTLGGLYAAFSAQATGDRSVVGVWLGILFYTLMLYFDFSGYSDMAIGLGRVFGFDFPENFRYPYVSRSVTDFWRRWHASLGAWFRDYVYIPFGGSRRGTARTVVNLAVVWLLTGIWHGANLTFVVWGLYHLAWLIVEKFLLRRQLDKLPVPLRRMITFAAVAIGWVLFFSPDLPSALRVLGAAVGVGVPFINGAALYQLLTGGVIVLVALVGCTPLPARAAAAVAKRRTLAIDLVTVLLFAVLLLFCIAGMVGGTVSSFLYAQF